MCAHRTWLAWATAERVLHPSLCFCLRGCFPSLVLPFSFPLC